MLSRSVESQLYTTLYYSLHVINTGTEICNMFTRAAPIMKISTHLIIAKVELIRIQSGPVRLRLHYQYSLTTIHYEELTLIFIIMQWFVADWKLGAITRYVASSFGGRLAGAQPCTSIYTCVASYGRPPSVRFSYSQKYQWNPEPNFLCHYLLRHNGSVDLRHACIKRQPTRFFQSDCRVTDLPVAVRARISLYGSTERSYFQYR